MGGVTIERICRLWYYMSMNDDAVQTSPQDVHVSESLKFICPKDGEISQDDVIFLCNVCKQDELIFRDGVYMCPSCLNPGDNFQCMICDSKEVRMVSKKKS